MRKSVEVDHWGAVKANDSNRDTTISHQALSLMESETSGSVSERLPPAPIVLFDFPSLYYEFQFSIHRALPGC